MNETVNAPDAVREDESNGLEEHLTVEVPLEIRAGNYFCSTSDPEVPVDFPTDI
jgi:hypothetical protein